jgi:hypothetical protein
LSSAVDETRRNEARSGERGVTEGPYGFFASFEEGGAGAGGDGR